MKAVTRVFLGYCLLASLIIPSIAVPTTAADFFPLDVWAEMVDWQSNHAIDHEPLTEAIFRQTEKAAGDTNRLDLTFPFDVATTLKDLERADGRLAGGRSLTLNRPLKRPQNPYWLPEECYPPGGPLLTSEADTD